MKKDHKDVPTEMTEQEKLLAEEWHRRESREEKDRRATEKWEKVWSKFQANKKQQEAEEKKKPSATQTKEEAERAEGDDRDDDADYIPSEEPSSEDPLYEATK